MSESNLRAVGYVRANTASQPSRQVVLFNQQDAIRRDCDMNGLELVGWFKEPNRSGLDTDRPVFHQMMTAATARHRGFDRIVVASASRFSRSVSQLEACRRRLEQVGVELAIVSAAG